MFMESTQKTKNYRSYNHEKSQDQYLRRMLSTSASILSLRIESRRATSETTLEAASSASSLDLLKTLSVAIRDAASSAAILDLLRASSVAMREAATSAANRDLLSADSAST
jgi:hypothetical protein